MLVILKTALSKTFLFSLWMTYLKLRRGPNAKAEEQSRLGIGRTQVLELDKLQFNF